VLEEFKEPGEFKEFGEPSEPREFNEFGALRYVRESLLFII
jgi:hypothetical protein